MNRYIRDLIPGAGHFRLPSIVSEDSTDGNLNTISNPIKHQSQPKVNPPTIAEDVLMSNKLIDLVGSNQLPLLENDELSTLNTNVDSIDSETVNDEPVKKRARLSLDQSDERTARNDFFISSSVDSIKTAIVSAPSSTVPTQTPSLASAINRKISVNQPTANDADCSSTTTTLNTEKCFDIMESSKNPSKSFKYVCDKNAKLQHELRSVTTNYDRQIKLLESRNAELTDELKIKTDQLASEKLEHDRMISVYNQMIRRKDEERMKAVNETKKQCEEDYARRLEANKKRTFCVACNCNARS